jgi:outer membrane autotransporter protein
MFKSAIAAVAATPFIASAAFAGPYVESKTTTALSDGTYKGAQTELRVGYEEKVAPTVTVFGEIGPGYEWTKGTTTTTGETVAVGEVGVKVKATDKVSVNAKVTGEYGNTSEIFDMGGELKVRYSF